MIWPINLERKLFVEEYRPEQRFPLPRYGRKQADCIRTLLQCAECFSIFGNKRNSQTCAFAHSCRVEGPLMYLACQEGSSFRFRNLVNVCLGLTTNRRHHPPHVQGDTKLAYSFSDDVISTRQIFENDLPAGIDSVQLVCSDLREGSAGRYFVWMPKWQEMTRKSQTNLLKNTCTHTPSVFMYTLIMQRTDQVAENASPLHRILDD
jgi:hypothetical protein